MGFKRRDPSKLQNQIEEMTSSGNYEDKAEWKLTLDSAGNGSAHIRFLPSKDDDSVPFVKIYTHGFKDKSTGKWFVENCPTTLGNSDDGFKCPVCEANSELWNTGLESNKKLASHRKRNLSYWANVLVIKDSKNPDAEGKIFKYRFGSKIMEKIQAKANPPEELGEDPVDVTCVFDGCDFFLSTKKVAGYQNYDDSQFKSSKPIANIDDEEYQDKLIADMHTLADIIKPTEFKKYEDLQKQFVRATGEKASVGKAQADAEKELDDLGSDLDKMDKKASKSKSKSKSKDEEDDDLDDLLNDTAESDSSTDNEEEDDDDDLDDLLKDL